MPLAEGNSRVQLTLSDEMIDRMDRQRKAAGLSRSAYISSLIGQTVPIAEFTEETVLEMFEDPQKLDEFVETAQKMAAMIRAEKAS